MKIEVTISPVQAQAFQKQLDQIISRNSAADKVQQQILALLTKTEKEFTTEMAKLDDDLLALQTEVANDSTVIGGAVTLINGIGAQIAAAVAAAQAAGATPAQLAGFEAVTATLAANDSALAAAVAANTPGSTGAPVPPVVPPTP